MAKNIFDSHAHYNDDAFSNDADEVLTRLFAGDVAYIVNVGCNIEATKLAKAQSERYERLYYSAGIHPEDALGLPDDYLDEIRSLALGEKCVAIGEIGLDYHWDSVPRELQKKVFTEQLILAKELSKPVIIHSRDAMGDTLEIIKSVGYYSGVVHCYSGSAETAKELVSLGWYIGFTGVVTFNNAKKAVKSAAAVPMNRLLVETDCPYMAPVPHRGKRCTSDMIYHTACALAEIKQTDVDTILNATCENAKQMYGI